MHTRTHAVYCNTNFRDAASRNIQKGWQPPSMDESGRSDGTWQGQQENAQCGNAGEVSSQASPEVLGAVDLLSLRGASWTGQLCQEGRSGDHGSVQGGGCPAIFYQSELCRCTKPADATGGNTPAEAAFCWQSHVDTTSSAAGSADRDLLQSTQYPAVSVQFQLAPKSSLLAKGGLYTERAGLQPTCKGRARSPSCIKQWAALTTWLRMNLHQARTAKRQVCFVGHMSHQHDRWVFDLNPKLPWSEVSAETKQRLRTLPKEAEQAYAHKYPSRDVAGWQEKAVKYKPGNFTEAHNILLGDLVHDLHSLYRKYEVHSRRSSRY